MLNATKIRLAIASTSLILVPVALIACGSALSAVGDDCAADTDCESGLCDDQSFCATPVAATDGKPCTTDTTCPTGDHCHVATGDCFSNASDGLGGNNACTTDADCSGDETCGSDHTCQG